MEPAWASIIFTGSNELLPGWYSAIREGESGTSDLQSGNSQLETGNVTLVSRRLRAVSIPYVVG